MDSIGNATAAAHWRGYEAAGAAAIRLQLGPEWSAALGVHAAAESLNAPGFATPTEVAGILGLQLDDATQVCSYSNFNQCEGRACGFRGSLGFAHAPFSPGSQTGFSRRSATAAPWTRPSRLSTVAGVPKSSLARHPSGKSPTLTGCCSSDRDRPARSLTPCHTVKTARRASVTRGGEFGVALRGTASLQ